MNLIWDVYVEPSLYYSIFVYTGIFFLVYFFLLIMVTLVN